MIDEKYSCRIQSSCTYEKMSPRRDWFVTGFLDRDEMRQRETRRAMRNFQDYMDRANGNRRGYHSRKLTTQSGPSQPTQAELADWAVERVELARQ